MNLFGQRKGVDAMRVKLRSIVVSIATAGMIALSASGFAADGDSSSSVRGSLGASLGDLSFDDAGGIWAFVLNAVFALAFIIAARRMARPAARQSGSARSTYSSADHVTQSLG
jgi:hypothetical protein